MPGAEFGGIFRRVLGNNPSTLDPAFVTDIYGGAIVRQIFDGLVQFDAHLKPLPAIAEFWEASRIDSPGPSPCAGGSRFIMGGR